MDLEDKLRNELTAAPAEVPESLRGEAVEKLVRDAPHPQNIAAMKPKKKHKALRVIGLVAASIVLLNILGLVGDAGYRFAYNRRLERKSGTAVADVVREDDPYAAVKTAVLTRYIDRYASRQYKTPSILIDLMRMGVKYSVAEDYAVNESAPAPAVARDDGFYKAASGANSGYSETNVQVRGVDEADIVKTDGKYIYSASDGVVRITDVRDPAKMTVVRELDAGADASVGGLYLYEGRLIVILQTAGPRNEVRTEIYDVTDPAHAERVYQHRTDGYVVSSRVTDGKLLLVTDYSIPYTGYYTSNVTAACESLSEACVPRYAVNGGEEKRPPAENILIPEAESCSSYSSVTLIDLDAPDAEPEMMSVLTDSTNVYCSAKYIYISAYEWETWDSAYYGRSWVGSSTGGMTHIEKIGFADGHLTEIGCGEARGSRFSSDSYGMDEYDGYFRIALNCYNAASVYVFDEKMELVGELDGIGENEEIFGVRFDGDRGYLVTFYQTDPLFTIDLADPKDPKLLGELKIPGYSAYLHPVGDGLMVGVGADGTEDGLNGGAKVSLYDVSDPENPVELDVWTRADANADTDPHAFVSLPQGMFSVNVLDYMNGRAFIALFRVEDGALRQVGSYEFPGDDDTRAVFIGDAVFAVCRSGIAAYDGRTARELGVLEFDAYRNYGYGDDAVIYD